MRSLAELEADGYCVVDWRTWQQGECLTYAVALILLDPRLRFGTLYDEDSPVHHFAHDDRYAYDSSGRHPLPHRGVHDEFTAVLDEDPSWYDPPYDIEAAKAHAIKHQILSGAYAPRGHKEAHA